MSNIIARLFSKEDIRSYKAKKNILLSFFFRGIGIIIQLLLVPIALSYLSSEKYGVWLTLSSIIGWISFFDIGLGNGLRNQLTVSLAEKNYDLGKRLVSTTYFLLTAIFSVIIIVFLSINQFIDWNSILNTNSLSQSELKKISSIIICTFILRFIFSLIGVIAHSYQRSSINDMFISISNVFTLIFIYLLTKFSNENLLYFGFIYTIVPIIVFIIGSFFLFSKDFIKTRPSLKLLDFKLSKKLLNLGVKFFIVQITAIVLFSTSNFIITQISGPKDVTKYNIAFQYFQFSVMAYSIIGTPFWSAITDAFSKKDFNWINNSIKRLNQISIIFIFIIIIFLSLSNYIYRLWIGNGIEIPQMLSISIAIWAIINITIFPYSIFISATGKLSVSLMLSIINILVFPILAYRLGKSFLGTSGVMFATDIVLIISSLIIYIQVNKIMKGKANGIWNK